MFDAYTSDKGSEFSGGKVDISYSRDINSFIHNRSNEEIKEENNNSKNENTQTGLHLKMVNEGEEIGTLDVESDEEDENE